MKQYTKIQGTEPGFNKLTFYLCTEISNHKHMNIYDLVYFQRVTGHSLNVSSSRIMSILERTTRTSEPPGNKTKFTQTYCGLNPHHFGSGFQPHIDIL